jgi:hypothetical protein
MTQVLVIYFKDYFILILESFCRADTLNHKFFYPNEVAVENEELQQNKNVVDLVKGESRTFRTAAQDKQLREISAGITKLGKQLQKYHGATSKMLATILKGEIVPKYICLVPYVDKDKGQWWDKLLEWSKPSFWLNKWVMLYFVCPVTFAIPKDDSGNSVGYTFCLPHDWVKKYGPALLFSLNVLKVACGLGRLAGLPLPVLSDVVGTAKEFIGSHTEALMVLYDAIRADEDMAPIGDWIDGQVSAYTDLSVAENVSMPIKCQQLTKASYEDVKMLAASEQIKDPEFLKCGLKRAEYKKDGCDDKEFEFVAPSVYRLYVARGEACLNLTEDDIKKLLKEEDEKKKEEEKSYPCKCVLV